MKKLKIFAGMVMTLIVVTACGPLGSKTQASQASTGNMAMPHTVCGMADNNSGVTILVTNTSVSGGGCAYYVAAQTTGNWYVLPPNSIQKRTVVSCALTTHTRTGFDTVVVLGDGPHANALYGSICARLIWGGYSSNAAVLAQWRAFERQQGGSR